MICKLLSKSKKKILYPWKYNSIENDIPIELVETFGLCVEYNENYYIFSTAHKINYNSEFYCNDKKLKLLYFNKDLDVLILENNINL